MMVCEDARKYVVDMFAPFHCVGETFWWPFTGQGETLFREKYANASIMTNAGYGHLTPRRS